MSQYVIGVDGGNSKTDVVVAAASGRVLSRVRGPGVDSPLPDITGWGERLLGTVEQARSDAGVHGPAACAAYFLANVDLAAERRPARSLLDRAGCARITVVHNDTLAVLRAGATREWGVAVVAGAGINAVGVHPGGRISGFLSFGRISGDRGGGYDLGMGALSAAMRAQDGRGPATVLAEHVPRRFGLRRPADVAIAVHDGRLDGDRLLDLAPVVLAAAAARDAVAQGLADEFADEVSLMGVTLLRRLHLLRSDAEVVLGGGVLQGDPDGVAERAIQQILGAAPRVRPSVLTVPPVYGALVEALRSAKARPAALARARRDLVGPDA